MYSRGLAFVSFAHCCISIVDTSPFRCSLCLLSSRLRGYVTIVPLCYTLSISGADRGTAMSVSSTVTHTNFNPVTARPVTAIRVVRAQRQPSSPSTKKALALSRISTSSVSPYHGTYWTMRPFDKNWDPVGPTEWTKFLRDNGTQIVTKVSNAQGELNGVR